MFNSISASNVATNAMAKVYGVMGIGLLISFVIAFLVGTNPEALHAIYGTALKWPVILAPLGLILIMGFGRNSLSSEAMTILYGLFTALEGLSLATIFVKYDGANIAGTLLTTGVLFGAMSAWGYKTGKDLTHLGTFLFMALIGIILAMILNIFLQSGVFAFIINVVGILLFLALTAYDTQQIKYNIANGGVTWNFIIWGALDLYLDFINLFLFLLGLKKND